MIEISENAIKRADDGLDALVNSLTAGSSLKEKIDMESVNLLIAADRRAVEGLKKKIKRWIFKIVKNNDILGPGYFLFTQKIKGRL
jgi:hypothetical protein